METEKIKTYYPHPAVMAIAEELLLRLKPFCERIRIVGSLRREKAEVGDLELLYIPILKTERDGLFDEKQNDAAEEEILWMIKEGVLVKRLKAMNGTTTWGRLNKYATHVKSGIPVDLFATDNEKWFISLLIRTGPAGFNIRVITELAKRGYKLHAYGVIDNLLTGERIVPKSEEEILELAGMQFEEPKHRKQI